MERTHVLGRICFVVVLFVHLFFFYSKSSYVALDDLNRHCKPDRPQAHKGQSTSAS